jgi:hypothetical protein
MLSKFAGTSNVLYEPSIRRCVERYYALNILKENMWTYDQGIHPPTSDFSGFSEESGTIEQPEPTPQAGGAQTDEAPVETDPHETDPHETVATELDVIHGDGEGGVDNPMDSNDEIPSEESSEDEMEAYLQETFGEIREETPEENRNRLWEQEHQGRMLRQGTLYFETLPSLTWLYAGQIPMKPGADREAYADYPHRDYLYTCLNKLFGWPYSER